MKRIIFALVLAAALAAFAWTLRRFGRLLAAGRAESRTDRVGDRLQSVWAYFFGQKKVVEKTTLPARRWPRFVSAMGSKYHFVIFWGFIIITVGTGETLVQGLWPSFSLAGVFGARIGEGIYTAVDVCTLLVLLVIGFAVFRRTVLRPRLIPMSRGRSTTRRNTAKTISASTSTFATSITAQSARASVSPRITAREKDGKRPWISVSVVPMVMTMKPQKITKWYLLPTAVTKRCQRAAGIVAFSTTFFCPKK